MRAGRHYMGHEKEPPPMHKRGGGGRQPLVHSHSKRAKRSIKAGGRKR